MPDKYDFDHLPEWGIVYHRCIWCGEPGHGIVVTEEQRKRHWRKHERARKKEADAKRQGNLAKARAALKEYRRT